MHRRLAVPMLPVRVWVHCPRASNGLLSPRSSLPSSRTPLLGPSPLRTVLKTFAIYGSSPSNALLGRTRLRNGKMEAMNLVAALWVKKNAVRSAFRAPAKKAEECWYPKRIPPMGPSAVCEVGFIDGIIRVGFGFDFNVSCNGCAGGGKQPHFLRFPLLIACFPKEGPVPPPVERKVFRFGPTEVFVWVSSSRPSPQTREDGCIDAAKGTLADHVPMIVGPAPNLGVEFLNQIGGRHTQRGFDRGSDARQESFDVFFGGFLEPSPVGG